MSQDRERINTGNDGRFIRRDEQGRFKESVDIGRSIAADRRKQAKTLGPKGHGDRGDQPKQVDR